MSSFEEEALKRAQQMNKKQTFFRENPGKSVEKEHKRDTVSRQESQERSRPEDGVSNNQALSKGTNIIDVMFKNKDESLILLLIILLMDEKADPSLLLALVYLLM